MLREELDINSFAVDYLLLVGMGLDGTLDITCDYTFQFEVAPGLTCLMPESRKQGSDLRRLCVQSSSLMH
jgi:hypothetical protein